MSVEISASDRARLLGVLALKIAAGCVVVVGIVEALRFVMLHYFGVALAEKLGLLLYLVGMSAVGAYSIGNYRKGLARVDESAPDKK